mgnify:CR=1 FL=1
MIIHIILYGLSHYLEMVASSSVETQNYTAF